MTWDQLKRLINPNTNPALIPWLISAALAVWQGFETAPGPLSWAKVGRVLGPVLIGLAVGYQRSKTTPVKDPRDGNGEPLLRPGAIDIAALNAPAQPARNLTWAGAGEVKDAQPDPTTTTTGASA